MKQALETDVLVLGCGIAGSTAALLLAEQGVSVTVVTRSQQPQESNTYYAQGGIIYRGKKDSPTLLADDFIRAGAGHCYPAMVQLLAENGPELVKDILIDKVGVQFDQNAGGRLSFVREGSHSVPRILHAADATGKAIETALINALQAHHNIRLFPSCTAVDLLTPSHHSINRLTLYEPRSCIGAYLFSQGKKHVYRCLAKDTILATGGLGQIFLQSSNPPGARGDGLAMANRAGARIINAEFIQFHPTTFYHKQAPRFLISEAVRGAGARLTHANGEPFMQKYAPEWKDLAPRDIVARAIHQEMLEYDVPNVYLDLRSYMAPQDIQHHFPTISQTCRSYGIDITSDLVPVVPAAHYFCGGVWADRWGHTTIQNLYAIGEVACTGVHGANRLASSSLLEGLFWGSQAAAHIVGKLSRQQLYSQVEIPEWHDDSEVLPDPALISQDMSSIKHIMWNYVGLIRTDSRLKRAIRELRHLEVEIEHFYRETGLSDHLIGLRNAVRNALLVTLAAWQNKRSVGCHYRE